ncbi:GreA/GreB family elongation factor [Deinococcus yavapaiensis]|uniref:Transcription elongation factor GreA n=1 Tax=Deinococcus yavapaiensis KR-236 TaxID=694435 RepID=A0A318SNY8_9DEIO|nr:GreA/GreB family elongation factor [Deinococcus yavapaiensis]PYE54460.1 transcription elongation factor GreA [Deinococcus yavapaiensis KR-236]
MQHEIKLTPQGYARLERALQQQRDRLEDARRVVRDQLEANDAENLGLSEAQDHLLAVEARLQEIEDTLARAVVLESETLDVSTATIGAVVALRDVASGRELRVQLVSPAEVTGTIDGVARISTDSPVGSRLLGRQVGEAFEVPLGRRSVTYVVHALDRME